MFRIRLFSKIYENEPNIDKSDDKRLFAGHKRRFGVLLNFNFINF